MIYLTNWERHRALPAIGLGIVAYAIAAAFYPLLDRTRRKSGAAVRARAKGRRKKG